MTAYSDREIMKVVSSLTMVGTGGLKFAIDSARELASSSVPGVIAEFGVWKGGCSIAIALAQRGFDRWRPVWMFDSFEGLPPSEAIDGFAAARYQADKDAPDYHDNCKAGFDDVAKACVELLNSNEYVIVPGRFEDTIDKLPNEVALLRIDCDWYKAVSLVLDKAAPKVVKGGIIIIDDYYAWDGCAIAVHEWLAQNRYAALKIHTIENHCGAYIVKG